jgi:ATP-dependent helicase/nuclease subunit A
LQSISSDHFAGRPKLRLGELPAALLPLTAQADHQPHLPEWISAAAPAPHMRKPRALTGLLSDKSIPGSAAAIAARRGTAIHVMLEALASVPPEKWDKLAKRKALSLGLTTQDADHLVGILQLPALQVFLVDEARSEVELFFAPDGQTMSGRIDRMVVRDDGIWLLDYKTTRNPPSQIDERDEAVQQLSLYAKALAEAYPGRPVHACLLFTQTRALHWLTLTR